MLKITSELLNLFSRHSYLAVCLSISYVTVNIICAIAWASSDNTPYCWVFLVLTAYKQYIQFLNKLFYFFARMPVLIRMGGKSVFGQRLERLAMAVLHDMPK